MLDFGPEMKAAGLAGRLVSIQSLRRRGRFWRYALLLGGRATIAFLGLLGIAIGGSALAYWKFAHHHSWVIIPGALVAIVVLMEAAYHRWEQAEASRELAVRERDAEREAHEQTRKAREVQYKLYLQTLKVYTHRHDDGSYYARVSLVLLNGSDLPLRYDIENFSAEINGKTLNEPPEFHTSGGIVVSGAATDYTYPDIRGLTADDVKAKGFVEYTVTYGYPTGDRFRKKERLELHFPHEGSAEPRYFTVSASDEDI